MAQKKVYDKEFKIQAVKLGREIGFSKVAKGLGINMETLYGCDKRAKDARLDLGPGYQMPDTAWASRRRCRGLDSKTEHRRRKLPI